ncbi:Crt homolog 2 (Chloroquine resistance transporter paralog 2) (DdCRTp2) [Durusdinium trenchii]
MQSVFGACAVNCAVSIVSTCLYYSELHHLREFPFFAAQLNAAIGAFLAGLWFAALPKGTQQVPQWQQWASLSGLLALQNTLEILSIPRVGNEDLPPILQQAVVPLSLLFSWQLLRRKYSKVQLLGATMVVAGVTAGFLPSLWNTGGKTVSPSWVAIFLLSRVPQAAANVAAESLAENHQGLSWPIRATLYTQLLGLPCNLVAGLIASYIWKGEAAVVLQDYTSGLDCLFHGGGSCAGTWSSVLLFAIPGMLYTLTEFHVLQVASATAYFLLAALQLPLQDLALSLLNGTLASFHMSMLPAILAVALGLVLYGLGSPTERH